MLNETQKMKSNSSLFCLGHRFAKYKLTKYAENFGVWPLSPPSLVTPVLASVV